MKDKIIQVITENKKALMDFEIIEEYESGLQLLGSEVKSVRQGQISLKDSYVDFLNGEPYLIHCHISPYKMAGIRKYNPERKRKLLLKRYEIKRLLGKSKQKGLTIIPLKIYLKRRWIKILIGIVKGKRKYEKRQILKEREIEREIERELKRRR